MGAISKPVGLIQGKRMILREITPEDVTDRYVSWMNDPEVVQFLETRFQAYTKETLLDYVEEKLSDNHSAFLGMILHNGKRHIGNIKLGPINWIHSVGSIGIMIGEKDSFGKGYATEAIGLVIDYAFGRLSLHKLTAGCYDRNRGALRAFEKNGFVIEGVRKQHVSCCGEFIDVIELGLINSRYRDNE
ncbi:N-acetyltransferase [Candidatus Parcubacteria bacterium]|nr:MAG: N-acetyltransferase [Candidatus Parcubacteria bacterium]